MQDRPTASELLQAVTELLEETIMPATEGGVRHQARVAANLCRIVVRDIEEGPLQEARQAQLLAAVLGRNLDGDSIDAQDLNRELTDRLLADDTAIESDAWRALVQIVAGKLDVAKPGYTDYDYSSEIPK